MRDIAERTGLSKSTVARKLGMVRSEMSRLSQASHVSQCPTL